MIRIGVTGAYGRMGQAVIAALDELDEKHGLRLAGLHARSGSASSVASGVPVTDDLATLLAGVDIVIDFTLPSLTAELAAACRKAGIGLVCGTTGLQEAEMDALRQLGETQPVFYARNMSVGVNLLLDLVARASKALGVEYDAEIVEAHHRHKQDAPSGTALAIGEAVATARGQVLSEVVDHGREGKTGERETGRIGMHAVRAGEIVGEHDLRLVGGGEELRLGHSAFSRRAFADGALRAAAWLAGQPAGLYGFPDMLDEDD